MHSRENTICMQEERLFQKPKKKVVQLLFLDMVGAENFDFLRDKAAVHISWTGYWLY